MMLPKRWGNIPACYQQISPALTAQRCRLTSKTRPMDAVRLSSLTAQKLALGGLAPQARAPGSRFSQRCDCLLATLLS